MDCELKGHVDMNAVCGMLVSHWNIGPSGFSCLRCTPVMDSIYRQCEILYLTHGKQAPSRHD